MNYRNKQAENNLAYQIRKSISYRVACCFILAMIVMTLYTASEISNSKQALIESIQNKCDSVNSFVIREVLLGNERSIQPKLDTLTGENKSVYTWHPTTNLPPGIHWDGLLSWKYNYPIRSLQGKPMGVIVVSGLLINNHTLVRNFLARVGLLCTFFATILLILFPLTNRIPKQLFVTPIHNVLALLRNKSNQDSNDKLTNLPKEIDEIYLKISTLLEDTEKHSRDIALGQIATQVAHDIRSPIQVLTRILKNQTTMPEKAKLDAEKALQRVTDIANNLLSQHKNTEEKRNDHAKPSAEYAKALIESIISEKNIQISGQNISLRLHVADNAHGSFILVDSINFKRVLSNIINNAIESFSSKPASQKEITITLSLHGNQVHIEIKDNGCGIPKDKIEAILTRGLSYNKPEGVGLGLPYAVDKINGWNGQYSLESTEGVGTLFKIILPCTTPAPWFQSEIIISNDTIVIVLDDEPYIHDIWKERFSQLDTANIQLKHYDEPADFIAHYTNPRNQPVIFLVDNGLDNYHKSGIEITQQLNINHQTTLVTNCYDNEKIIEQAAEAGIKIIPKPYSELIPISLAKQNTEVLIDDDEMITDLWQEIAEEQQISLDTYNTSEDFFAVANTYPLNTTVYIDACLGDEKGEDIAKTLYDRGYQNLYLATGYTKESLKHVTWVKNILGKTPPWA